MNRLGQIVIFTDWYDHLFYRGCDLRFAIVFLLTLTGAYYSAFTQEYRSHFFDGEKLTVYCDWADIEIEPYTENIVRVVLFPFQKKFHDTSYSVILKPQKPNVLFSEKTDRLVLKTDSLELRIPKGKFGIEYFRNGKMVAKHIENSFFQAYEIKGCRFGLRPDEGMYGLGAKAVDLNKRNINTVLYNQNVYGYTWGASWLNTNIPLILSTNNYGLYFDSHSLSYYDADLIKENTLQYNVNEGPFKYFLIGGDSFTSLLQKYWHLTGRQPMPPRWTFGFIQSKCA